MNSNTFAGLFGGTGRNQVLAQTLAATTETVLLMGSDTGTSVPAVLSAPIQTSIVGSQSPFDVNVNGAQLDGGFNRTTSPWSNLPGFNSSSFDGRPIKLRWVGVGSAAANAGNTLVFGLYQGTSATVGSDKKIAANTAIATATAASFAFSCEATIIWDPTSGQMTADGRVVFAYNGTAALSATWTGAAATGLTNAATALNFVTTITWGNAVGGVITTREMSLEQV